jgi:multidrug resistance efflux pump
MPPTKKRGVLIVAALVLCALGALVFVRSRGGSTLTGIVTTDMVMVSPEIQGRLERLLVREGDRVESGQLLAAIRAEEWQADLNFYESSERQAEALVAQAAADLQHQQAVTASQIGQAEAASAAAEARVAAAAAENERAAISFQRAASLRQGGVSSIEEFDEARIRRTEAEALLEALRQQAVAANAALAAARAGESQVAAREASLRASRDVLAAARARKARAATQLSYAEVHSPIDGIVNLRSALQGEVVSPGRPILGLVNSDDYWVRIDVEESLLGGIRPGDRLTVRLPSGLEREGEVFHIAVDADYATQRDVNRSKRDIRTFEVRLRCDNSDRALALGMTAYVNLPSAAGR